jgi:hypothetical protein
MSTLSSLSLFLLGVVCICTVSRAADDANAVTQIEKDCVDYRRAIKSGHVVIESAISQPQESGEVVEYSRRVEVFFTPDKIRFNQTTEGDGEVAKSYLLKCIRTPSEVFSRTSMGPEDEKKVLQVREPPVSNSDLMIFDPRIVGLSSSSSLAHYEFDTLVGHLDRKDAATWREREADHEVTVVRYTRKGDVQVRIHFRENDSRRVTRIETRSDFRGQVLVDRVDSEYADLKKDEVVFPRKLVYRRLLDGVEVLTETQTFKKAEFNRPIDEGQFTLLTLGLRPGTLILYPKAPVHVWNGSVAVPYRGVGIEP